MRILDAFSGAGGAAMGYHLAFPDAEIVGIDVVDQPRYPFVFLRADAMACLANIPFVRSFDLIHASPPCQHYSQMSKCRPGLAATYPDLVAPTRALLQASGVPYVIENVVGAPLVNPTMICGSGLGMTLQRHRLFETSFPMMGVPCAHGQNSWNAAYGHSTGRTRRRVPVIGEWRIPKHLQDEAMGIDWMTLRELSEAIPPAYCEFIGAQFAGSLKSAA